MATTKARSDRGNVRHSRGAWRVAVGAGTHPDGRRRSLYATVPGAKDDRAAEQKARDVMYDLVREARLLRDSANPGGATLGAVVNHYLAWGEREGGKNGEGWSPNTIRNYSTWNEELIQTSTLADKAADEIRVYEIEALYDTAPTRHVRLAVHRLIHAALADAVRREVITTNVAAKTKRMARPKSKVVPPTRTQLRDLLYLLEKEDAYTFALVRLAAITGARRGTLAGLTWDKIGLDGPHPAVWFDTAIARGRGKRPGSYTVKGLKAENEYGVALDPETVAVLRRHRAWCAELALASPGDSPRWVFPSTRNLGHPLSPDAITARWERARVHVPGMETTRFHDVRHYVATQLFAAGKSAVDVAARLGHERPSTTLDIYGKKVEESNAANSDLLAATLGAVAAE